MVEINRGACTGCGQCTRDCIAKNLSLREGCLLYTSDAADEL